MIKNLKPDVNSKYEQGYFRPLNLTKYIGELPIIYRSSWELKFMQWCDRNENVIQWMSEPASHSIHYINLLTGKKHKYYPDFFIRIMNEGIIQEHIIEVKPKAQLQKPKKPLKVSQKSFLNYQRKNEIYVKNLSKFKYMNEYCQNYGYKYIYITEDWNKIFKQ